MSVRAEAKLSHKYASQVETSFDSDRGIYWAFMRPAPRPCFNPQLLRELNEFIRTVKDGLNQSSAIHYGVLASGTPGVFNLGGDLSLFRGFIHEQDRSALLAYGKSCIENLFAWHRNCDGPMTSIALVQGEALGGGFEAALSATTLIAEESSRFGFPEILFNLFPGMGAFSFLSRKVGRRAAEEMIISGTIYSARQLYDLGVIDVLTPDGTGQAAVHSFVSKHSKSMGGRQAFERARNAVTPVSEDELLRVVEIWADTALKLNERDLKVMDRLIRAQSRNNVQGDSDASNVVRLHASNA